MHIKHLEKDEKQQKADEVRIAHEAEWLMALNVELVATMKDEKDNYFVAIGVQMLGIDYKLPAKIDGVPIRIMDYKKVTYSTGATDITYSLGSGGVS